VPSGQQRLLEGVLGILERAEHPVAVHVQLSAERFGQRAERVAVSAARPVDQVSGHHARFTFVGTFLRLHLDMDTGHGANWAAGERPVCSSRGVYLGGC
jgi:hypothetical protein